MILMAEKIKIIQPNNQSINQSITRPSSIQDKNSHAFRMSSVSDSITEPNEQFSTNKKSSTKCEW
jgi:hypothetical protein